MRIMTKPRPLRAAFSSNYLSHCVEMETKQAGDGLVNNLERNEGSSFKPKLSMLKLHWVSFHTKDILRQTTLLENGAIGSAKVRVESAVPLQPFSGLGATAWIKLYPLYFIDFSLSAVSFSLSLPPSLLLCLALLPRDI